jgi:hypothetical protein
VWGFTGNPAHAEASAWLGRSLAPASEGLRSLILRYLVAFGPATVKDISAWSGLPRLHDAVKALRAELCVYRDERGNELFDVPGSPLPADVAAPPRFLPEFDNLLLAHADRHRIISDAFRSSVFLTVGRVRATFLVDGFVAGTWRIEKAQNVARLIIEPFEPIAGEVRDALIKEGERLVRFVEEGAETFEVQFAKSGRE